MINRLDDVWWLVSSFSDVLYSDSNSNFLPNIIHSIFWKFATVTCYNNWKNILIKTIPCNLFSSATSSDNFDRWLATSFSNVWFSESNDMFQILLHVIDSFKNQNNVLMKTIPCNLLSCATSSNNSDR